jgi:hypothetical protein
MNRPEGNLRLWAVCTGIAVLVFAGAGVVGTLAVGAGPDTGSALLVATAAGLVVGWAVYDGLNRRRDRPDDEAADYEDRA